MRLFRRTRRPIAQPPGTVHYAEERKVEEVRLHLLDYDAGELVEQDLESAAECFAYRDTTRPAWINVDGLHDGALLEKLGVHFGLHPLVLEDIVNIHQRPKMEDYQSYLYIVAKMIHFDAAETEVSAEQVSLIVGPTYVFSFQERPGDVFEAVRARIRSGKGRARRMGVDYLAYMLLDAVVDHYFVILEAIGEKIEALEEELIENPHPTQLQMIHELKREMILLRRSIWPMREIVSGLERSESDLVREETVVFLRDLYDHTIQIIDAVESFRDVLSSLQDLYLSSISNRMNEVMKVLTIIATLFTPLGFLAGVFGMNFEWMPELKWKWSYPLFWVAILSVAGGMYAYFRRKRWM